MSLSLSEKVPLPCTNVACLCDKPFVVQQRRREKRTPNRDVTRLFRLNNVSYSGCTNG
jgi:hypothetical protein